MTLSLKELILKIRFKKVTKNDILSFMNDTDKEEYLNSHLKEVTEYLNDNNALINDITNYKNIDISLIKVSHYKKSKNKCGLINKICSYEDSYFAEDFSEEFYRIISNDILSKNFHIEYFLNEIGKYIDCDEWKKHFKSFRLSTLFKLNHLDYSTRKKISHYLSELNIVWDFTSSCNCVSEKDRICEVCEENFSSLITFDCLEELIKNLNINDNLFTYPMFVFIAYRIHRIEYLKNIFENMFEKKLRIMNNYNLIDGTLVPSGEIELFHNEGKCPICYENLENKIVCIFINCKHIICSDCHISNEKESACATCRTQSEKIIYIKYKTRRTFV